MRAQWKDVNVFRGQHMQCPLVYTKSTDNSNSVKIECQLHKKEIVASIPYELFCHNPALCAGRNSCPRDYACSE